MILGYGSVLDAAGRRFAAFRRDDEIVDLTGVDAALFADGTLDALLAAGYGTWGDIDVVAYRAPATHDLADVRPQLPFTVADYTDFYASRHHATNAGRLFRPGSDPLPANWLHVPVGYHGRSATVVVSDTPVRRPCGVLSPDEYAPSRRLDFEAEVGFVVGVGGRDIAIEDVRHHVFGVCLLNDWSARDIQAFETVPLGPFLGKSFATSIAAWITPLSRLRGARRRHEQEPAPLPHLRDDERNRLDLELEIRRNDVVLSRPRFADMHWTFAQLLTHLTSNGTAVRPGDLYGSGTVSGPSAGELGCLLELTGNGAHPVAGGTWLSDGDEVSITARAGGVELAEVRGRVVKP